MHIVQACLVSFLHTSLVSRVCHISTKYWHMDQDLKKNRSCVHNVLKRQLWKSIMPHEKFKLINDLHHTWIGVECNEMENLLLQLGITVSLSNLLGPWSNRPPDQFPLTEDTDFLTFPSLTNKICFRLACYSKHLSRVSHFFIVVLGTWLCQGYTA